MQTRSTPHHPSDEVMILGLLTRQIGVKFLIAGVDAARFGTDDREPSVWPAVEDQPDPPARVPVFLRAEHPAQSPRPHLSPVPVPPLLPLKEPRLIAFAMEGLVRFPIPV